MKTTEMIKELTAEELGEALEAATPHLRAGIAEEVRALIEQTPERAKVFGPHSYKAGMRRVLALLEGGGE